MARYDYKCPQCEYECEVSHGMTVEVITYCPACQTVEMKRQISQTSFSLRGTGWYASGGYNSTEQGDRARADKIELERSKNIAKGTVKQFVKKGHL